jgi:hypothetical protein
MEEREEGEEGMRYIYHSSYRCLVVAGITYQAPNQRGSKMRAPSRVGGHP